MPYYSEEERLPNKEHFEEVYNMIKHGEQLHLGHIHYIFGRQFFEIMIFALTTGCKHKSIEDVKELLKND